jgi:hypothetical protein
MQATNAARARIPNIKFFEIEVMLLFLGKHRNNFTSEFSILFFSKILFRQFGVFGRRHRINEIIACF